MVAGFFPHKGHFEVLKLAKTFLDLGFRDFKIFMRGSHVYKSYVEDIRAEIEKKGLVHFVVFEPFVKEITLQQIYAKFNVVLLVSEYEGFGLPVLEAQSQSVPVVCSDIPIFREILQESAFFLNSNLKIGDAREFINLIKNEEELESKILEGLNNVKRFSWCNMSHETLSLYKSFLKDGQEMS